MRSLTTPFGVVALRFSLLANRARFPLIRLGRRERKGKQNHRTQRIIKYIPRDCCVRRLLTGSGRALTDTAKPRETLSLEERNSRGIIIAYNTFERCQVLHATYRNKIKKVSIYRNLMNHLMLFMAFVSERVNCLMALKISSVLSSVISAVTSGIC